MRAARGWIEELRLKYAQMLAMRVTHAAGGEDEEEARARMAELAARFPGALRELDDLALDEIRRRVHVLDDVLQAGAEVEPWMDAVARFHALARGALCAKRWLGRRRHVDADLEQAFAAALTGLAFPEDARAWSGHLTSIASPPHGRIMGAVFARLAHELDTSERAARVLVFGAPRRERLG